MSMDNAAALVRIFTLALTPLLLIGAGGALAHNGDDQLLAVKFQPAPLCGAARTGKTFAAACIANELLKSGYSVVMTSLVKLIDGGTDDLVYRMRDIDLLILDDLGAERSTDILLCVSFFYLQ